MLSMIFNGSINLAIVKIIRLCDIKIIATFGLFNTITKLKMAINKILKLGIAFAEFILLYVFRIKILNQINV